MDNDNKQNAIIMASSLNHIHILECSSSKHHHDSSMLEKTISFNLSFDKLTISTVINLIYASFQLISKKLHLFDWKGIEIIEDADLSNIIDTRILFFIKKGDLFNNKNILRLFSIDKLLGEGGFGKVYHSTMKYTPNKSYAIKYLKHNKLIDVDYFFKEINLLLRLEHSNIIKLHSYCSTEEEGDIALIMEYASGGTLKKFIKDKGQLDEETARRILIQILKTVSYCHDQGVIHHDLKTDNIVFDNQSNLHIQVIDFGISTLLNSQSKGGSLAYISPEVLSGSNIASLPSVDIWAIGCILYEMVVGHKLFQGKNQDEIRNKILNRTVDFPLTLSIECVNLIDSLLTLNPNQRITIDKALNHPWIKGMKLVEENSIRRSRTLCVIKGVGSGCASNNVSSSKSNCNSSKTNRLKSYVNNDKSLNKSKHMLTKVTNIKDDALFSFNLTVLKNIPRYMAPIGYNREQKLNTTKFRDFYSSIQVQLAENNKSKRERDKETISIQLPASLPLPLLSNSHRHKNHYSSNLKKRTRKIYIKENHVLI